jgi:phosphoenolpyruvate carboxykinase (ATP)
MKEHRVNAWLLNTGWNGGAYGVGSRIKLRYTRAIIDAIHSGELEQTYAKGDYATLPKFNLQYPNHCPKVPDESM